MKNNIFKVLILIILFLGLFSCDTNKYFNLKKIVNQTLLIKSIPNQLVKYEKIKVGAILPLKTKEGKIIKNALELAIGNNKNNKIILFIESNGDSTSTNLTYSAVNKLLAKNVKIIIGPIRSRNVKITAKATNNTIPIIAFSQDINLAGNNVYLQTILREDEIKYVVKHSSIKGFNKFASLTPKNKLGKIIAKTFKEIANQYGTLVASSTYIPYSFKSNKIQKIQFIKDIKNFAIKANLNGATAILIPEGPETNKNISKILKSIKFKNNKIKFLGTSLWNNPNIKKIPILLGGWYATALADDNFIYQYTEYTGEILTTNRAAFAYDAMSLITKLSYHHPIDQQIKFTEFINKKTHNSVLGYYTYTDNNISSYNLKIIQINNKF